MNALVLQMGPLRPDAQFPDAQWLVEQGYDVTLLVSRLPATARAPRGVTVVEVGDLEQVTPLVRLERFVVLAAPAALMRRIRALVASAASIRGLGRPAVIAGRAAARANALQYRASRGVHARWSSGPYRVIRSLLLWRLLERARLDLLSGSRWDLVVCGDRDSVSTAWHLARRYPQVSVTYGVNKLLPAGRPLAAAS
jgi:hypothetical protein